MTKRESQLASLPFFQRVWIRFLAAVTPDCEQIAQMASHSLEQPLSMRARLQMKFHFLICDGCARYLQQIKWLHRISCQAKTPSPGDGAVALAPEDKQRLKAWLKSDGGKPGV